MAQVIKNCFYVVVALLSLSSCQHDEPDNPIKPLSERSLLAIDLHGNIYDIEGSLIKSLPDCRTVTQIIVVDGDYFVSGVNSKDKVGYWKNGKWHTLHVDFIDDVDHWTYGIAKWDYNIYLLDYPNVLRNSGIFRLKDSEDFTAARHGISVSEGKCYVVGFDQEQSGEFNFKYLPVIYTERKGVYEKTFMPLPAGVTEGQCSAIYSYDRDHYVAGGLTDGVATIWEDNKVYQLPRLFDYEVPPGSLGTTSSVHGVVKVGQHIYAAGVEYDESHLPVCVFWTDGVPQKLVHDTSRRIISMVADIIAYGDDVYVLTEESPLGTQSTDYQVTSVIWLNGTCIATIPMEITSIAVY